MKWVMLGDVQIEQRQEGQKSHVNLADESLGSFLRTAEATVATFRVGDSRRVQNRLDSIGVNRALFVGERLRAHDCGA